MKLNLDGCSEYFDEKGIDDYQSASEELGLSVIALKYLERGAEIGYDAVRDIYNKLGEDTVRQIIDFGQETMDGFKSKYILVGDKLY